MAYTNAVKDKRASVKQVEKTATLLMNQIAGGGSATGISDAPVNGEAYVRKDEGWSALNNLTETVTVGITDAPSDNNIYVRVNGAWQLLDNSQANA